MKPRRGEKGAGSLLKLAGCRFWYAQFYRNHRAVRISTRTTNKQEAKAVLRKLMGDSERGLAPITDIRKLTYGELRAGLLANYVERGNRSLRPRIDGAETIAGLPQLDAFFGFSTDSLGPSVVRITTDAGRDFVKARQAEDAGNAVINRSLACLRRMLRIAYEEGKIQTVPVIRLLKEPPARNGFVTSDRFENLIRLLPSHLQPLVEFLYWCGVRVGEALAIDWEQVDFAAEIIRLQQTKNDQPRVIPLPAALRIRLAKIEPKVGRVFSAVNLRKEWMKACAACGEGHIIKVPGRPYDPHYEGLTIHDLRRSAIRNLVNAGVPETHVMRISGHKTRSVFDRYAIASEGDLRAAMRKVESQSLLSQGSISERLMKTSGQMLHK